MAKAIPEGFHSITPMLVVKGGARAIEFYKKAFGAEDRYRVAAPDGRIMHAELRIGDSILMLTDEMPEAGGRGPLLLGGSPVGLMIYCEDADVLYQRAVAAGATVHTPMTDAFWGDRFGTVTDPFGHVWSIATRKRDVAPQELERAARDHYAQATKKK